MTASIDIYAERLTAHENRISAVEEQQRIYAKREIIQFVVGVLAIIGSIFGAGGFISWQNAKLIEQFEKRLEQNERHFNVRIETLEKNATARIEALEKSTNARFDDLTARFEDLKQVVLSQRR